jgi:hypothetical protein
MDLQDVHNIYKVYKESYERDFSDEELRPGPRSRPDEDSGYVTGYLQHGKYEDAEVSFEFRDGDIRGATDVDTGRDIPLEDIDPRDIERAMDKLNYNARNY